jgi:hypothetical protein
MTGQDYNWIIILLAVLAGYIVETLTKKEVENV